MVDQWELDLSGLTNDVQQCTELINESSELLELVQGEGPREGCNTCLGGSRNCRRTFGRKHDVPEHSVMSGGAGGLNLMMISFRVGAACARPACW